MEIDRILLAETPIRGSQQHLLHPEKTTVSESRPRRLSSRRSLSTQNFHQLEGTNVVNSKIVTEPEISPFYSLLKESHRAAKYIFIRKYTNTASDEKEIQSRREAMASNAAKLMSKLQQFLRELYDAEHALKIKETRICKKMVLIHKEPTTKSKLGRIQKVCRKIRIDMRHIFCTRYISYIVDLSTDVKTIQHLVTLFQEEKSDNEIQVNLNTLKGMFTNYPENDPVALKELNEIRGFKKYINSLSEPTKGTPEMTLDEVVKCAEASLDESGIFFEDTTILSRGFLSNLDLLNDDFTRRIERATARCRETPSQSGEIILAESTNVYQQFKQSKDTLPVLFMFMSRYIFSEIYQLESPIKTSDIEFLNKVDKLTHFPPAKFGEASRYLPEKFKWVPLWYFTRNHPYEKVLDHLDMLLFETNPIDFCKHLYRTLHQIQKTALKIVCEKEEQKTGQIVGKTQHMLNSDELTDISIVLLLLSNPVELRELMFTFEKYIHGLGLPQQMVFAFTTLQAVYHAIMMIDIEAMRQRSEEEKALVNEPDPLNIG